MTIQKAPHDTLFRLAFEQVQNAAGLLRALLPPALVAAVDWSSLELTDGSYVDPELRTLENDLVFSARLQEREAFFYLLVEHQSTADPWMVWRLWRYVTRTLERWTREHPDARRMPLVIPLVVYHGARPWNAPRSIAELFDVDAETLGDAADAVVPRFTYILDDLTQLAPEKLRERALPAFGALALWALQNAATGQFARTVGLVRDLFDDVHASQNGAEALGAIFRYLSIVTGDDDRNIVDEVLAELSEPVRENAMSLYDKLIAQGEAKGRAEGEANALADVLSKLLTLKFGALPEDIMARIGSASVDQLDRWVERVLTAESLDDVLA